MSEWQPIETAPKDGTKVDLFICVPDLKNQGSLIPAARITDCWFSEENNRWEHYEKKWYGDVVWAKIFGDDVITHWKSLPESPADVPNT